MAVQRYKARIRLADGRSLEVFVDAGRYFDAKAAIEAQYGKGCIISGPTVA